MSLVAIHNQLSSSDEVLEKKAAEEFEKLAEEDAAGRIMARGFMAELHKIAQTPAITGQRVTGAGAGDPAVRRSSAPGGQMAALSRGLPKQGPKPPTPPKPAAGSSTPAITGQRVTGAGAGDPAVRRSSAPGGMMRALSRRMVATQPVAK